METRAGESRLFVVFGDVTASRKSLRNATSIVAGELVGWTFDITFMMSTLRWFSHVEC